MYFGELRIAVWAVSIAALVIVVPIWWARSVRTHRDAAEIERARAEALSRVAELDRRAAITTERQRLARDLHDVVAGHLSSIAIQSEAALRLRDSDPDRALTVLESVRSGSVAALQEMQSMVRLLRSDDTDDEITTAVVSPTSNRSPPPHVPPAPPSGSTVIHPQTSTRRSISRPTASSRRP